MESERESKRSKPSNTIQKAKSTTSWIIEGKIIFKGECKEWYKYGKVAGIHYPLQIEDDNEEVVFVTVWNDLASCTFDKAEVGKKIKISKGKFEKENQISLNDEKSIEIEGEEITLFSQTPKYDILFVVEKIGKLEDYQTKTFLSCKRDLVGRSDKFGSLVVRLYGNCAKSTFKDQEVYFFRDIKKKKHYPLCESTKKTSIEIPNTIESSNLKKWYITTYLEEFIRFYGYDNILSFFKGLEQDRNRLQLAGIPIGPMFLSIQGYGDTLSEIFRYIEDSRTKGFHYLALTIEDGFNNPDRECALKNGLSSDFTFLSQEKCKVMLKESDFFYEVFDCLKKFEVKTWEDFEENVSGFYRFYKERVPLEKETFMKKINWIWKGK